MRPALGVSARSRRSNPVRSASATSGAHSTARNAGFAATRRVKVAKSAWVTPSLAARKRSTLYRPSTESRSINCTAAYSSWLRLARSLRNCCSTRTVTPKWPSVSSAAVASRGRAMRRARVIPVSRRPDQAHMKKGVNSSTPRMSPMVQASHCAPALSRATTPKPTSAVMPTDDATRHISGPRRSRKRNKCQLRVSMWAPV